MACEPSTLKRVSFFALLDDDELAVLASQVELRTFAPRQRIYKLGDSAGTASVLMSGAVRVTTIDADQQDALFDEPAGGDFFGFASLLDQTKPPMLGATPRMWVSAGKRGILDDSGGEETCPEAAPPGP